MEQKKANWESSQRAIIRKRNHILPNQCPSLRQPQKHRIMSQECGIWCPLLPGSPRLSLILKISAHVKQGINSLFSRHRNPWRLFLLADFACVQQTETNSHINCLSKFWINITALAASPPSSKLPGRKVGHRGSLPPAVKLMSIFHIQGHVDMTPLLYYIPMPMVLKVLSCSPQRSLWPNRATAAWKTQAVGPEVRKPA